MEPIKKYNLSAKRISRRKALNKISKYVAVTTLGTCSILNPLKAQAASPEEPEAPGSGF
tara:strand:- start:1066 stop:1242 length:177 start_codon:yes stop_codon:yes gene_type:complete